MKIKIFSFKPLTKAEQYGFNVVFQPEYERYSESEGENVTIPLGQFLIVGMRVMYGKIYAPAMTANARFIPAAFLDPQTAEELYDCILALETPPSMVPLEEAIGPIVIKEKVIDKYAKELI